MLVLQACRIEELLDHGGLGLKYKGRPRWLDRQAWNSYRQGIPRKNPSDFSRRVMYETVIVKPKTQDNGMSAEEGSRQ